MVESSLVPFTWSKQHEVAKLEYVVFYPKRKSIIWRTKKTLRMGTLLEIATVTKRTIVKDFEEDPVQMASWGVATAQVNSHNLNNFKETIDQYKGRMGEMKEILRNEERVGQE